MVVKTLTRICLAVLVATIVVVANFITARIAHAVLAIGIAKALKTTPMTMRKASWCVNFGMALVAPMSTLAVGLTLAAVQLCQTGAGPLVIFARKAKKEAEAKEQAKA